MNTGGGDVREHVGNMFDESTWEAVRQLKVLCWRLSKDQYVQGVSAEVIRALFSEIERLTAALDAAVTQGREQAIEEAASLFHPHPDVDCKLEGCDYGLVERERAAAIRALAPVSPAGSGGSESA